MIEVQVIDNGVGIKEENKKKLFKLFGFISET
jgi:signal transduction histidine kinase